MLPKRWIVERTIAWLNRCRRLAKDWECLNRKALAFLRLASIRLMVTGAKPGPHWVRSGGLASAADEFWKVRDDTSSGDTEPGAKVVPEGDAKFPAGLCKSEEGVAAVAADIALGSAADLALGNLAADVVLRAVGVQRDLRVIEHHQQLGLVGVQPLKQTVEGGEARVPLEDTIEARTQFTASAWRRIEPVGLQIGIEPPDQSANMLLRTTLLVGKRLQLVNQALGVDPAQRVVADVELPGVVADHDRLAQEPVCAHRAPQRALGGDAHRVGCHLQTG